jgi:hypothetical protein
VTLFDPDRDKNCKIFVATWWEDYMESAAEELKGRPMGVTVLDPELMDEALKDAIVAGSPAEVFADMREFGEMFAAEVDKAVAEASRNFPFLGPTIYLAQLSRLCSTLRCEAVVPLTIISVYSTFSVVLPQTLLVLEVPKRDVNFLLWWHGCT